MNALSPANNVGIPWDTNTQSWWAIEYLYAEPLLVYTRQGTIEPWLATSWTVDATSASPSITFSLRKGVKFQDGTDFNADAVKWQMDKALSIAAANTGSWKSIDVVDPYTVKLNLKSFQNSIWQDLSGLNANVFFISPTQYQQKGEDYAREHPIGTGPFQVSSFSKDQAIKLKRFDGYWGGKPYLDEVDLAVVQDVVTQQVAMRAGTGQVMLLMDPKTMSDMKGQGFNILQFPAGSSIIVGDSANANSHFANPKVMEAINIGIDKKAVADANGYGYMFPSSQLAPLGNPAQVSTIPNNPYDPVKAKQLLSDAGYPNGFQTTLITWQYDVDGALIVQQQLAKIGITSTVNNVDNLKFWDYINNGWNDSLMVWSASSGPNFAASFKNLWPPYGSGNKSVKAPDAMKALIDQCLSAVDTADATKLNQQLNQMIYDSKMIVTYETGGLGTILSSKVHDSDFAFGSDMFLSWRPAKTWLSK